MSDIPDGFFLLNNDDYSVLLAKKDEVSIEMQALGSIVLTTNMNVQVLMKDIVEKKKRSIARIDASTVGRIFLSKMIQEAEINELSFLIRRSKVAERLTSLRNKTNEEMTIYQELLRNQNLEDRHTKVLVWKFIKTKQKEMQSKATLGLSINEVDDIDIFVGTIIVEELHWLKQYILKSIS